MLDLVASVEERAALKDNRDTRSAATQIQVAAKGPFVFELAPHGVISGLGLCGHQIYGLFFR